LSFLTSQSKVAKMTYTHLSQDERYQIYEMRLEKKTLSEIAVHLKRHKSTIQRELQRNRGQSGWRPGQAQRISLERQTNSRNARRINEADWDQVVAYLHQDLSPQQAIERLSLETGQKLRLSHETVYQRIATNRCAGGTLYQHRRCQKRQRKRYGSGQQLRGMLKNRVSIDERPAIVNDKSQDGHWEGDTVVGSHQQGGIITLTERRARFLLVAGIQSKHAEIVTAEILGLLQPHQARCQTITFDNGKEFAGHEEIAAGLQAKVYFAHPYSPWERGLNENTNGLLRQYFPKKTNLKQVTLQALQQAADRLNHRPRKCLGYRTPFEVFYNLDILPLNSYIRCTS